MYYVSIMQGICFNNHHTHADACIYTCSSLTLEKNKMGFWRLLYKKNIMFLKNIHVHVGTYELTKVKTAFQVCKSFCFKQSDKLLYIYVSHFIRALPGLRVISYNTHIYILCTRVIWLQTRRLYNGVADHVEITR